MEQQSVENFLSRSDSSGKEISQKEIEAVNDELGGIIPGWYFELLTSYPLSGVEVGWQAFTPEEGFDGVEWIQILDIPLIQEINSKGLPGEFLSKLGYFIFGYGSSWAGNAFAIPQNGNEGSVVYEVWHDAARNMDEMKAAFKESKGVRVVANSFSELLNDAKV